MKTIFFKSVESINNNDNWCMELAGQINERIILSSIDNRSDADHEEYRLLVDGYRFAEMQANGYNISYPSYLNQ